MAVEVVSTREILATLKRLVHNARTESYSGIVFRCRSASEALPLLRLVRPPFLLLDPEIPWRGEIEVMKEIQRSRLPTKVVVVVPRLDAPEALEIARLGPAAMIAGDLPRPLLDEALQAALAPTVGNNGTEM